MKRTVLMLAFSFPPLAAVGGFRSARFVRFLPECNWQPVVIAPTPESANRRAIDPSLERLLPPDAIIHRAAMWQPRRWLDRLRGRTADMASVEIAPPTGSLSPKRPRSKLRRTLDSCRSAATVPFATPDSYIWWAVPAIREAMRAIRRYEPDVIFSTSPPHSVHLIALVLKLLTGLPWVMDFRDPWSRNPFEEQRDWQCRRVAQRGLERLCVEHADRVILNTPATLADFRGFYRRSITDRFAMIPNGYDPELRPVVEALIQEAGSRPPSAPLRLCHAGAVHGRRDIRPLIVAVAKLNRTGHPVVLEQVGSVDNLEDVRRCISDHHAEGWVTLLGRQSHEEALRRQAAADVLVVIRQNSGFQVPAKLYEMLLFNKPILALDDEGATTTLVWDYDLGTIADPVNPDAIAEAIVRSFAEQREHRSSGRTAALREFDSREQTRTLSTVLAEAINHACEATGRRCPKGQNASR